MMEREKAEKEEERKRAANNQNLRPASREDIQREQLRRAAAQRTPPGLDIRGEDQLQELIDDYV